MSHVNQDKRYELVQKLLKMPILSSSKLLLRHVDQTKNSATEMIAETGTTDKAIGDVTAEVMITTLGKIPNQMYYLEDTNPPQMEAFGGNTEDNSYTTEYNNAAMPSTEMTKDNTEHGYSALLVSLLCVLVVILFICCVTACIVAKSKRKTNFFNKGCEPGCTGMSQPLLDKISECSSKASTSTQRN
ncbi:uncharacterized protein LOC143359833 [Halictus rubicundus]|uniref:uncharacterized protein LOC143359833 n=1 Tax=Halictus rubicundus TaxID=77578 RepID=UPI0040368A90